DESALRITDGSEELSGLLDPPGSIELRSRSEDGFFRPQSRVYFLVDGRQTESTGYGTNLALQSPVGPNTRLVGAPVLGADSYELLAGGSAYSENPGPRVSRADLPDFALPGYPSIVLTALNGGRPLLELSYALRPGHQPPSPTQVSS